MKKIQPQTLSNVLATFQRKRLFLAIAAQCMFAAPAFAGPEGGKVVGGSGSIDQSGNLTTVVQDTQSLALDWESFNVNADETVRFIQPGEDSVALNRILSNDASHIFGQIEANGQIILTNPNGVFFGKDATINVGSLVASGLSIDPDEFMNGQFTLDAIDNTEGFVLNHGIINAATGGSVTLVGKKVENQGLITAKLGSVSLAAGKQAVLTFDSQGLLGVRVTEEVLQQDIGVDAAVQNSGEINADGGKVLLTASTSQDVFSKAVNSGGLSGETSVVIHDDGSFTLGGGADVVNTGTISVASSTSDEPAGAVVVLGENIHNSGTISADSSSGNAGHIELHAADTTLIIDEGVVTASASEQGQGGDVKVLGDKVGLSENTNVKADGAEGGGQVLVGGDQQGENDQIRNAEFVYLGKDTTVSASAESNGDGGTVIVYADDSARIYGELSATGGSQSGNGGFIETSGKKGFDLDVVPDVRADNGVAGTWLIDPYDITIDVVPTSGVELDSGRFDPILGSATIDINDVLQALSDGGTVTISTALNVEGDQAGDVTINADINAVSSDTAWLSINSFGSIFINGNIDASASSAALNISFNANQGGQQGNIIAGDVSINTNGGYIAFDGYDVDVGQVVFNTSDSLGDSSSIDLWARNDLTVGALGVNRLNEATPAALVFSLEANNQMNLLGSIYSNAAAVGIDASEINFADGMVISTDPVGGNFGAAGHVSITSTSTTTPLTLPNIITHGDGLRAVLRINASSDVEIANDLSLDGSLIVDTTGDVLISDLNLVQINSGVGDIDITAGGSVSIGSGIPDTEAFILPDLDSFDESMNTSLMIEAGDNVVISQHISLAEGVVAISAGGNSDVDSTGIGEIRATGFSTRGDVVLRSSNLVILGEVGTVIDDESIRRPSSLTVLSGGEITSSGSLGLVPSIRHTNGDILYQSTEDAVSTSHQQTYSINGERNFTVDFPELIENPSNLRRVVIPVDPVLVANQVRTDLASNGGVIQIISDGDVSFGDGLIIDTSGPTDINTESWVNITANTDIILPSIITNPESNNASITVVSDSGSIETDSLISSNGNITFRAENDINISDDTEIELAGDSSRFLSDQLKFSLTAGNTIYFGAKTPGSDANIFAVPYLNDLGSPNEYSMEFSAGYGVYLASSIALGQGDLVVHGGNDLDRNDAGEVDGLDFKGVESVGVLTTEGNVIIRGGDVSTVRYVGSLSTLPGFDLTPSGLYVGAGQEVRLSSSKIIDGDIYFVSGSSALEANTSFSLGGQSYNLPQLYISDFVSQIPGVLTSEGGVSDRVISSNGGDVSFDVGSIYFPGSVVLDSSGAQGNGDIQISASTGSVVVPRIEYSQSSSSNDAIIDITAVTDVIWLANFDYNNVNATVNLTAGNSQSVILGVKEGDVNYPPVPGAGPGPTVEWSEDLLEGNIFDSDPTSNNTITFNLSAPNGSVIHKVNLDADDGSYIVNNAQDVTIYNESLFNIGGITAENLTLEVGDGVTQSPNGIISVAGDTIIQTLQDNPVDSTDIQLTESNDINRLELDLQITGGASNPARIYDANGFILGDVDTNFSLDIRTDSPDASITQDGSWVFDGSTSGRFNSILVAAQFYIGNSGLDSVELNNSDLYLSNFDRLLVDGTINAITAQGENTPSLILTSGSPDDIVIRDGDGLSVELGDIVLTPNAEFLDLDENSALSLTDRDNTVFVDTNFALSIRTLGGDDTVTLNGNVDSVGVIDGGDGTNDILDYTALGGGEYNFLTQTGGNTILIDDANFETVSGGGDGSFFSGDGDFTWDFNGDDFTITQIGGQGETGTFSVHEYTNLRGSSGANTFIFNSGTNFQGNIEGNVLGSNTIEVDTGLNFLIDAQDSGSLVDDIDLQIATFANVSNFVGGDLVNFTLTDTGVVSGSITGIGTSQLFLDAPNLTGYTWNLGSVNSSDSIASFTGIADIESNSVGDVILMDDSSDVSTFTVAGGSARIENFSTGDWALGSNDGIGYFIRTTVFDGGISEIVSSNPDVDANWAAADAGFEGRFDLEDDLSFAVEGVHFDGFNFIDARNSPSLDAGESTIADLSDQGRTWRLTGVNSIGNVGEVESADGATVLTFSGITNIQAGAGIDVLELNSNALGLIELGAGDDRVLFQDSVITDGASIANIDGGLGVDVFENDSNSNVDWNIQSNGDVSIQSTVTLEEFSATGFESLVGENGRQDSFIYFTADYQNVGLDVDGGSTQGIPDRDRVVFETAVTGPVQVSYPNATWSDIEIVALSQASPGSVFTMAGGVEGQDVNTWSLSNDFQMELSSQRNGIGGPTVSIQAFDSFVGESADDTFNFSGSLQGTYTVSGGGGSNAILVSDLDNLTWVLQSDGGQVAQDSSTFEVGFSEVQRIFGSNGSDQLSIDANSNYSLIDLSSGDDVFTVVGANVQVADLLLGDGDDVATIRQDTLISGQFDGGEGLADELIYDGFTGAVVYNFATDTESGGGVSGTNFETLPVLDSYTVVGGDGNLVWTFNNASGGFTITDNNDARTKVFDGTGTAVSLIQSGAGTNQFVFEDGAYFGGHIEANAAGGNRLILGDYTNVNGNPSNVLINAIDGGELQYLNANDVTTFSNIASISAGQDVQFTLLESGAITGALIGAGSSSLTLDAPQLQGYGWNLGAENSSDSIALFSGMGTLTSNSVGDNISISGSTDVTAFFANGGNALVDVTAAGNVLVGWQFGVGFEIMGVDFFNSSTSLSQVNINEAADSVWSGVVTGGNSIVQLSDDLALVYEGVTFTGIDTIDVSAERTNRLVDAQDLLTLQDISVDSREWQLIDGTEASGSITTSDFSNTIDFIGFDNLQASSGSDTLQLNTSWSGQIDLGDGDDTVIQNQADLSASIDGGLGVDTFINNTTESGSLWNIESPTLVTTQFGSDDQVQVSATQFETLIGADSVSDDFWFLAADLVNEGYSLEGGATELITGEDRVSVGSQGEIVGFVYPFASWTGIEMILNGGDRVGSSFTLVGGNSGEDSNVWTINSGLQVDVSYSRSGATQTIKTQYFNQFIGEGADDVFQLNHNPTDTPVVGGLTALGGIPYEFIGGAGNNSLQLTSLTSTDWQLDAGGAGSLIGENLDGSIWDNSITFSNITSIIGSDQADTFTLLDNASFASIDTGAGADTLTVTGTNVAIANLLLGAGDDQVILATDTVISGTIDGGADLDQITFEGVGDAEVDFLTGETDALVGIDYVNFEDEIFGDGTGSFTLFSGDDTDASQIFTWVFNDDNTFTLSNGTVTDTFNNSEFSQLRAGVGTHTFTFANGITYQGHIQADTQGTNTLALEGLFNQVIINSQDGGVIADQADTAIATFANIANYDLSGQINLQLTETGSISGLAQGAGDMPIFVDDADSATVNNWTIDAISSLPGRINQFAGWATINPGNSINNFSINGNSGLTLIDASGGTGTVFLNTADSQLEIVEGTSDTSILANGIRFLGRYEYEADPAQNAIVIANTTTDNNWEFNNVFDGILNYGASEAVNFSGFSSVQSLGSGTNTLVDTSAEDREWVILDGPNGGGLVTSINETNTLNFIGINDINAGSGSDVVRLESDWSGVINLGEGDNLVVQSNLEVNAQVIGGSGRDEFINRTGAGSDWLLDSANSFQVQYTNIDNTQFNIFASGFESIIGEDNQPDQFIYSTADYASIGVDIQGGINPAPAVDNPPLNGDRVRFFDVGDVEVLYPYAPWSGIELVEIANNNTAGTTSFTLVGGVSGADINNWLVQPVSAIATFSRGGEDFYINAIGFDNYIGEGADDNFVLEHSSAGQIGSLALTGYGLAGGGGINSIQLSSGEAINWLLDAGGAGTLQGQNWQNAITFSNITNISGSDQVDNITIQDASNYGDILTGAGDDSIELIGTATVNNVITGLGSDFVKLSDDAEIRGLIDAGNDAGDIEADGIVDTLDITELTEADELNFETGERTLNLSVANFEQTDRNPDAAFTVFGGDVDLIWTFNGENGFNIAYADGSRNQDFTNVSGVRGGVGVNEFILSEGARYTGAIEGGGDGLNNSLISNSDLSNWVVEDVNSGRVVDVNSEGFTFQNIAHLEGSDSPDFFTILDAGVITGSIAGGEGEFIGDTLEYQNNLQSTQWIIDSVSSTERVAAFSGFEFLFAGSGNDNRFEINGISDVNVINGTGDGGLVSELIFNVSDVQVDLETQDALFLGETLSFDGINRMVANAGTQNQISGYAAGATWTVEDVNSGSILLDDQTVPQLEVAFSGFNRLVGGVGSDTLLGPDNGRVVQWSIGELENDIWSEDENDVLREFISFSGVENLVGRGPDEIDSGDLFSFSGDIFEIQSISHGNQGNTMLYFREVESNLTFTYGLDGSLVFENGSNLINFDDSVGLIDITLAETVTENDYYADLIFDSLSETNLNSFYFSAGLSSANSHINISFTDSVDVRVDSLFVNSSVISVSADDGNVVDVLSSLATIFDGDLAISTSVGGQIFGADEASTWEIGESSVVYNESINFVGFEGIVSGGQDDNFVVSGLPEDIQISGGAGLDTITGPAFDNNWTIDGANTGTLNSTIQFTEIENITGNNQVDTVDIAATGQVTDINLGEGDDLVNFLGAGAVVSNIAMGAGADSVVLVDGVVINGLIDGGTNNGDDPTEGISDTLDLSALTTANELNWDTGETSLNIDNQDFEEVIQSNSQGFVVFGGDADLIWTFNGANGFTIAYADGSRSEDFTNVSGIRGGTVGNQFILSDTAEFTGVIQGGGDATNNSLTTNELLNNWILDGLNSGSVQNSDASVVTTFTGIANLIGSDAGDQFTLSETASFASIDGGAGADVMVGPNVDAFWGLTQNLVSAPDFVGESIALVYGSSEAVIRDIETIQGGTGADTFDWAVNNYFPIAILGGAGDDIVIGDDGLGGPSDHWDIDAGTLNDILQFSEIENIEGGGRIVGPAAGAEWVIDGDSTGIINNSLRFSDGNYYLEGGDGDDVFTLENGSSIDSIASGLGNDTITVGDDVTIDSFFASGINAGGGSDTITIGQNLSVWDILGGEGDDIIGVSPGLQLGGVLDGGEGSNTLDVNAFNLDAAVGEDLAPLLGFSYANFADILRDNPGIYFAGDGYNLWFVEGDNSGRVIKNADSEAEVATFSDIHTLRGGDGQDIFIFANDDASISTLIDGGEGDNSIALAWDDNGNALAQNLINSWIIDGANSGNFTNDNNQAGNVFTNIASVIGGANQDNFDLIGSGALANIDGGAGTDALSANLGGDNTWSLTDNLGSLNGLVEFTSIESLVGGDGNDQFQIGSLNSGVNQIDGGAGDNSFALTFSEVATLNLATQTIGNIAFANVNSFAGNGVAHQLVGPNADTRWEILNAEGGTISYLAAADSNPVNINFQDFGAIQGGNAADHIILTENAQLTSEFNGGEGVDTLESTRSVDDAWVITSQDAVEWNGASAFFAVENLQAGSGADQITIADGAWMSGTVSAGAGVDTLVSETAVNNWEISGTYSGSLNGNTQFNEVESIVGGALEDTVNIAASARMDVVDLGNGDDVLNLLGANATVGEVTLGWGSDTITLVDGSVVSGVIDGGTDNIDDDADGVVDTIDMSQLSSSNEIDVVTGESNLNIAYAAFENIISGGDGLSLVVGDASDVEWTLFDGGRVDVTVIGGSSASYNNVAAVRGGAGVQNFYLAEDVAVNAQVVGDAEGTNTLYANTLIDSWIIDGINSGTANGDDAQVVFSNIANLVGSQTNETFNVLDGAQIGSIQGLAGDDILRLSENSSVGQFIGGDGLDAIYAADQNNLWNFETSDLNGMAFSEVENFVGGALADTFQFSDGNIPVNVDGGEGEDNISVTAGDNLWDLEASNINAAIEFANIETFTGGAGVDTLKGAEEINDWNIGDNGSGVLTGTTSQVNFSSMEVLQGGDQVDRFVIADNATVGTLRGGAGDDTFTLGEDVSLENLYAEAGNDSVVLSQGLSVSGEISGGDASEANTLNQVDVRAFDIQLAGQDPSTALGFTLINFSEIIDATPAGQIFVGNGTNYWFISGENSGYVTSVESGVETRTDFTDGSDLVGGTGEDYFIFANNEASITGSIDGGTGDNQLALTWDDQGNDLVQDLINTWLVNGANSGQLQNNTNVEGNLFTNIASVIGGGNQDLFTIQDAGVIASLTGGAGVDQLTVDTAANNLWELDTDLSSVNGTVEFADVEHLIGNANNDQFRLLSDNVTITQIDGVSGDDQVEIAFTGPALIDLDSQSIGALGFSNIDRLLGSDPSQVIQGASVATDWRIENDGVGSVSFLQPSNGNPVNIAFSGLGFEGGEGDDHFVIADGAQLNNVLTGGNGSDTVDLSETTSASVVGLGAGTQIPNAGTAVVIDGIESLVGSGQQATSIYGAGDQSYTWSIDGARSGSVTSSADDTAPSVAFTDVAAIYGGENDDLFQVLVSNTQISMDGGEALSADFVDYSQVNANLQINLAQALTGGNGEISGVEGVRGNNSGVDDVFTAELIGSDGTNTWTIGDLDEDGIADGVNDGAVSDGVNTVRFLDFNVLTGGAGQDIFNQDGGVIVGELRGGAGNDLLNVTVGADNRGTTFDGGIGQDALTINGGQADVLAVHTSTDDGGVFEYEVGEGTYELAYLNVENVNENSLSSAIEFRGGPVSGVITLRNNSVSVNGTSDVTFTGKNDLIVRAGTNDDIEIADHLNVPGSLVLINGQVITNDANNTSISAQQLVLDATQDVGTLNARIRTNVDELAVRNTIGDIALAEQNGLIISEFLGSGEFDLDLANGSLTNTGAISASDDFTVVAQAGDVALLQDNQIIGNARFTVSGDLTWENAGTMNIGGISANNVTLVGQRGMGAEGAVVVAEDTHLTAVNDINMENPLNDFNRVTIHDARDVSLVDRNQLELVSANIRGLLALNALGLQITGDALADSMVLRGGEGSAIIDGTLSTAGGGSIDISANQIIQNGSIVSGDSTSLSAVADIQQNASIESEGDVNASAENIIAAVDTTISGDAVSISASGDLTVQDIDANAVNLTGGQLVVTGGNVRAREGDIIVESEVGRYTMVNETVLEAGQGAIRISAGTNVSGDADMTGGSVEISAGEVDLGGKVTATQGGVSVAGANGVDVKQDVSGNSGVSISTEGSVNQSGSINANTGDVSVSAGDTGEVVMSGGSAIKVGQGNVNIEAGGDVIITEVVTSGSVQLDSRTGGIVDGNGAGSNVTADSLNANTNTGFGASDTLETNVSNVKVATNTGNVGISNSKDINVDQLTTGDGDIEIESVGDIQLQPGSVVADKQEGDSNVAITSVAGNVTQAGDRSEPAVKSDKVQVDASQGSVGDRGGIRLDAEVVIVDAAIQGGEIYTKPGVEPVMRFSSSYKFDDQIVTIEPVDDINPAVFTNVKSYFYNDISVLLPADQRFDLNEDDEEYEE